MREPVWLRARTVRAIHLRQLAEHGGLPGLRDAAALDSALARPRNHWAYADPRPDLAALAACYAVGIAGNHAFVDGNKRVSYVACKTFLRINGHDFSASAGERFRAWSHLAAGRLSEAELAAWLRQRTTGPSAEP